MNDDAQPQHRRKQMLENLSDVIADIMTGRIEFLVVAARYNGGEAVKTFQTGRLEVVLEEGVDAAVAALASAMTPGRFLSVEVEDRCEPTGTVQ